MKYRYSAWYFRAIAFALAAVCIAFGFLSGIASVYCISQGFYFSQGKAFQTTWQCSETVRNEGWDIIDQFRRNPDYDKWEKLLQNTDLRFIILDENTGEVKASCVTGLGITVPDNMANNPYLYEYNTNMDLGEAGSFLEDVYVCDYYFGTDSNGSTWASFSSKVNGEEMGWGSVYYEVYGSTVAEELTVEVETPLEVETPVEASYQIIYLLPKTLSRHSDDSIWNAYQVYSLFLNWGNSAPIIFAGCLVCFLAAMVFLLVTAGRKPGEDGVKSSWLERVPTDLLLFLGFCAGLGIVGCICITTNSIFSAYITTGELWMIGGLCAAASAACGVVILGALYSCAVHCKQKDFWRSMLLVRFCAWVWRPCGKAIRWVWACVALGVRAIGMVPRAVLAVLGILVVELLLFFWLVVSWDPVVPGVALIVFNLLVFFAVIWGFAQMRLLQKAAKSLADGDLESHLDTGKMYWDFKQHGEYLNAIAGGMNKAVEQRMKSERLKTELITNVSHDIKTPLTSIVNYVDLLQKPHTDAEGIQYLEVLDRQSKRLKKLTENLVEASKASTGNLPVELQPTSVLELLNQAVEEYRDRLEAGKLEIVMSLRGDLTVLADGKHMWRILDNLLNNVIKYALAGTRVYVTAEKRNDRVVIAVKNISRDPLNINADELMERFVRGDSARSTEGSGLGLNIARSLTVLQTGQFELTVDGDLFKAEISLPAV